MVFEYSNDAMLKWCVCVIGISEVVLMCIYVCIFYAYDY